MAMKQWFKTNLFIDRRLLASISLGFKVIMVLKFPGKGRSVLGFKTSVVRTDNTFDFMTWRTILKH
jgi:hypothetical protein